MELTYEDLSFFGELMDAPADANLGEWVNAWCAKNPEAAARIKARIEKRKKIKLAFGV